MPQARYRKEQALLKQLPCIPWVENLLKDGADGCALAALIHFYCPGVVRLEGEHAWGSPGRASAAQRAQRPPPPPPNPGRLCVSPGEPP